MHASIRAVPGSHVFNGKTKERSGKIVQKGVDVLLAIHAMTHVFRGNTKHITLLAGDADFAPLVRALVMESAYVKVWYARSSIDADLIDAADTSETMRIIHTMSCATESFRKRHEPPGIMNAHRPSIDGYTVAARGKNMFGEVLLYKGDQWLITGRPRSGSVLTHIYYRDRELLLRIAKDEGWVVEWETLG